MAQDQPIRFKCPKCEAKMRALASEAGAQRKCPKCEAKFRIPKPGGTSSKTASQPKSKSTTSGSTKRPTPKRKKKTEEEIVPVVCGVCNTRVYAKLSQVGSTVECPDCFTQNMVKPPPKEKKKKGPPAMMSDGYGLAPPQEIKVVPEVGKDRLEEADEIVQQQIDSAPKMPDKPFMSGVVAYPFYGRVFPIVLGLALAWTMWVIALSWAWTLEGFASAVAPVFLAIIALIGLTIAVPTMSTLLKIMEHSSNGDDESDIRPDGVFAILDSFVDVIPLVLAAAFSCVPTLGIVQLTGLGKPFEIAAAFCAFMLFPFIFISMMENASIVGVYSKNVWSSLTRIPGSWFMFALIAICLFAVGVGTVGALVMSDVSQLNNPTLFLLLTVVIFVLLCLVTIYFRLLGRLAFVLSQKVWIETKPSQNKTESSEDLSEDIGVSLAPK